MSTCEGAKPVSNAPAPEPSSAAAESPKPAAPRYSSTAPPPARKPFAYQAAAYAFWAPLVAIGLGFCISAALNRPGAVSAQTLRNISIALWCLDIFIILTALALGIFALLAIRRLGKGELLFRGGLGVLFSSLLAASIGWRYFHPPPTPRERLVGQWVTLA